MSGPTVRQRRLGAELRRLRGSMTLEEVVATTALSRSALSRIENGHHRIKPADLDALLDAYVLTDVSRRATLHTLARDSNKRGWWQTYQDQITPDYADLISLEDDARYMRSYESTLIPGLLQTAAYTRATVGAFTRDEPDHLTEARVAVRQARQGVLTRPDPLEMHAVVHQAALHHRVGAPHVMRDQLQRLLDMAELSNIVVQVLPLDAPATPALIGGFAVVGWGDPELDVATMETMQSTFYVEDALEVGKYNWAFGQITSAALSPDASAELILKLKDSTK